MNSHPICLLIVPCPGQPGQQAHQDLVSEAQRLRDHSQQRINDSLTRARALIELYPNHDTFSSMLSDILCDLYHCADGEHSLGRGLDVLNALRLARHSFLEDRWCAFGSDQEHGLIEDLEDLANAAEIPS